jgi:hypothetical protein
MRLLELTLELPQLLDAGDRRFALQPNVGTCRARALGTFQTRPLQVALQKLRLVCLRRVHGRILSIARSRSRRR